MIFIERGSLHNSVAYLIKLRTIFWSHHFLRFFFKVQQSVFLSFSEVDDTRVRRVDWLAIRYYVLVLAQEIFFGWIEWLASRLSIFYCNKVILLVRSEINAARVP